MTQYEGTELDRRLLGLGIWNPPVILTDADRIPQSKKERAKNKPGRFWARSSAGVYMNKHRRRMNGY